MCRRIVPSGSSHHLHTFSIALPRVPGGLRRGKGRGGRRVGMDAMRRVSVIVAFGVLLYVLGGAVTASRPSPENG
jgi:hypothetical protein